MCTRAHGAAIALRVNYVSCNQSSAPQRCEHLQPLRAGPCSSWAARWCCAVSRVSPSPTRLGRSWACPTPTWRPPHQSGPTSLRPSGPRCGRRRPATLQPAVMVHSAGASLWECEICALAGSPLVVATAVVAASIVQLQLVLFVASWPSWQ
jgi:hypothetical protein